MPWRRCRQRRTGRNVERAIQVERAGAPQRTLELLETRRLLSMSAPSAVHPPLNNLANVAPPDLTVTPSASTDVAANGYASGEIHPEYGVDAVRFSSSAGEGTGQTNANVTGIGDDESDHPIQTFGRWPGGHTALPAGADDYGSYRPQGDGVPQGFHYGFGPQGFHYGFGGNHWSPAYAAEAGRGRGIPDVADDYGDGRGSSAVFIVPGLGLKFSASPAVIIVAAPAPPVAGPAAIVFVPQPSGGSSGTGGTSDGYASSPAPPHVAGHRAHPAAAQGPSDAGDPAPIPMSVAAAAAGTLRPAADGGDLAARAAAGASDVVAAVIQTALANSADSNGAPGGTPGVSGVTMIPAFARATVTPGAAVVGDAITETSPVSVSVSVSAAAGAAADGRASPQLAEGAAALTQALARQATVWIHSIESALQTPTADASTSSDFVHLSLGQVRLLGLGTIGPEILSNASDRLWRTTAAVSLAVTLVGYGYCKAKSDRRRAQLQQALILGAAPILEVERPEEEL